MAIPLPLTNKLLSDIAQVTFDNGRYLEPDDLQVLKLAPQIEKLGQTFPDQRLLLLARLAITVGDREKVEYYLRNAERIHAESIQIDLVRITMLAMMGYCSESLPLLRKLCTRDGGALPLFLRDLPPTGSVHLINQAFDEAQKMNLKNVPTCPENYRLSAKIMDFWGDTDDDWAKALDAAGEVLRAKKLFFMSQGLELKPVDCPMDGGLPYVKVAYQVHVNVETAVDMTCEFADRLALSGVKIPQSMIFEFRSEEV